MRKYLVVYLLIVLFGSISLVSAQEAEQRDIFTALAYGDGVFEQETWFARVYDIEFGAQAVWESSTLGALAYVNHITPADPDDLDDLEAVVNDEWIADKLAEYESYEEISRCTIDGIILLDFEVVLDDTEYVLRSWTHTVSDTHLAEQFLIFPSEARDSLDEYAVRFVPDAPNCPNDEPEAALLDEPRREIYTALEHGEDVFETELWRVSAEEQADRTNASWFSDEFGAVADLVYFHIDEDADTDELIEGFDEEFFDVIWENYDSWLEVNRCEIENATLIEFDVVDEGYDYNVYFWINRESPTRMSHSFMAFPVDQLATMNKYSEKFAPVSGNCLD